MAYVIFYEILLSKSLQGFAEEIINLKMDMSILHALKCPRFSVFNI